MPQLRDYQTAMAGYLTARPGPIVSNSLLMLLRPGTAQPNRRLAIYKNNVYSRLVDALRDTFPATERLVGEDFFRYAATEYIARTPPKVSTLLTYGGEFPRFLENFPPASGVPYLADVAKLEILYLEAYHAADAAIADSAVTSDDSVSPALHPSARLLTSPFQVSRIWEMNRNDASFDNIVLLQQREYLLVIRPKREVEVRRLSPGAFTALLAFMGGATLAAARREAEWAEPDFDFPLHFAALVRGGTFCGVWKTDCSI